MRKACWWIPLLVVAGCGGSPSPAAQPTAVVAEPAPPAASSEPAQEQPPAAEAVDEGRGYSARALFENVSAFGSSFSADESKVLLTSDESGVFNVYEQPVAGGEPTRLTDSTTNAISGVAYFPADDRILFASDQGGNERVHVFVRELDGTTRDLTPGDEVKASFLGFAADDKSMFIATNERDPRFFDLYRYALDGDYARERLVENTYEWQLSAVSRDGRWVAFTKSVSNDDSDIYVLDRNKRRAKPRRVSVGKAPALEGVFTFTPDSKTLVYGTDGEGEFTQAVAYDLRRNKRRVLAKSEWDVSNVFYSKKGTYRVVTTNEDARTVVTVTETKTDKIVQLADLPAGDVTRVFFSPSDAKMALHLSSDRSPVNVHVVDLASGEHTQLTNTLNPAIDPAKLVDGEVVRFKSFDGLDIPSLLYRPQVASADSKVPAMLLIHGGPGGQSRLGYRALVQHLVSNGYAVFAVNNRGSSGYGKTFYHLDDRKHGDVDLKDCVWGKKYLQGLDWIDGERIGIMGGSYGGYMVLAALAFTPEEFAVGIDIFGVSNWLRTLASIPPWWASFRESLYAEIGDPDKEAERLRGNSPLFHADKITKPLLVVQGANDPRVLKVESDEIVEAVKKNGVPVEYVVFPDEGHGFRKRENRITASEAYLRFLDEHLR